MLLIFICFYILLQNFSELIYPLSSNHNLCQFVQKLLLYCCMGNEELSIHKSDNQAKSMVSFLKERNSAKHLSSSSPSVIARSSSSVFAVQKKWQQQLLSTLADMAKQPKWSQLAKDIREIVKTINQDMFVKAVTTINTILNTPASEFEVTIKKKQQMFNPRISVLVVVQEKPYQNPQQNDNSPNTVIQKKSQETIRKEVGHIIRKELNQKYHPVNQIKESFMMMFQMKFRSMLDQNKARTEEAKEKFNELMYNDIDFFCQLVVKGCTLYKPWIIKLTGIKQNKYVAFTKKMIVESLFSKHSMHQKIFPFLIELNTDFINTILQKIPSNLKISYFRLNSELQIQQNYHGAMMALSQIDCFTSPRKTLQQLNKIKNEVCNDIQNYHQHFQTGQTYSIDGDNMLGIICFMLCKLKAKMLDIYCQIQLLAVAYGDNLASVFESASYMVSTMSAAFDYLSSPHFGK